MPMHYIKGGLIYFYGVYGRDILTKDIEAPPRAMQLLYKYIHFPSSSYILESNSKWNLIQRLLI